MPGGFLSTNCKVEVLWYKVGHNWIKLVACKTAWPQHEVGRLQFRNNDLAISLILLIRDSTKPFWVWIYGIEY